MSPFFSFRNLLLRNYARKTRGWTRRQALWLIAGLTGSLALHACTQQTDTSYSIEDQLPESLSSSPSANQPVSATLGGVAWIGDLPLYIALDKGFFEEEGLNLTYQEFTSNAEGLAAFTRGSLDGFYSAISEAVSLAAKGVDCRIIMAADTSLGGDGILARNSIADIKDFKGKEIAVEVGGLSHFFLLQVLKTVGLSGNDVRITNVTPDAAAAEYQAGKIDIAVTYSPFLQKANQAQKDGRIIYDTSKMPAAIVAVYLFSTNFLEANPPGAKAFVQGILKGLNFLETNKDEALAIAGKRFQLTPEELEEQLKGVKLIDLPTNLEMLSDVQSDMYLLANMNDMAQFLKEQKQLLIPETDLSKLIEPKFVKDV